MKTNFLRANTTNHLRFCKFSDSGGPGSRQYRAQANPMTGLNRHEYRVRPGQPGLVERNIQEKYGPGQATVYLALTWTSRPVSNSC